MKKGSKIEEVLNLFDPDMEAVEKGKERQISVGRDEDTDYLPLLLGGVPVPERRGDCQPDKNYCQYNREGQFYGMRKMLFEQFFGLISTARGRSDAQLSVEHRMGAGFLPSCLGLEQEIFEEKNPWLRERLTKKEISHLKPEDLEDTSEKGLIPLAIKCVRYFRRKLGERSSVYVSFTWGFFSVAHLIRGDEIFIDIYRDPDLLPYLMDITTQLYVKASSVLKKSAGEPSHRGYHGNFYMGNISNLIDVDVVQSHKFMIVILQNSEAK